MQSGGSTEKRARGPNNWLLLGLLVGGLDWQIGKGAREVVIASPKWMFGGRQAAPF